MKTFKSIPLFFLLITLGYTINAQKKMNQKIKSTLFIFGLSQHFVVDNGKEFKFKFDTKNWNYTPFPSRITAEAYFKKGFALQAEAAYTSYKANKVVDNVVQNKDNTFFSTDFNFRYHFARLFLHPIFFDPYITAGYGFTYRTSANNKATGTNNLGLGSNFWVYKNWGINIQLLAKFALKGGTKSNYAQNSIGVVYRLKPIVGKPFLKSKR